MRHTYHFLAISIVLFSFMVLSCGAQTEQQDPVKKIVEATETVSATSATTLSISGGSLKGSGVDIPLGALPENSNVSVDLTDAPSDFSTVAADGSAIPSASSAMDVTATGSDGALISTLSSPMTIAISYSSLSLVEESDDNLCALLKSETGLFVWRKSDIEIVDGTAKFATRYLGTFQLVFCGQETLEGFSDIAENPEVAGASLKLTVDSSTMGYGAGQYCLVLIDGENDAENHNIHGTASALIDGGKHTMEISYLTNKLTSGSKPFIVMLFQNSGADCATDLTTTENYNPQHSRIIGFPTTIEKLQAGITGTFGSEDFAFTKFQLGTGTPEGTTKQYGTVPQENMCSNFDGGDNGFAELNLTSTADGLLNGASTVDMIIPTASKDSYEASVTVGQHCDNPSAATALSYKLRLKTPKNDKYSLVAVNFSTGAASCIQAFQGGTLKTDSPIAAIDIPASGSRIAFVPWDNKKQNTTTLNPIYDLAGFPSKACSESG